ncbi:hypothetical protein G5I_08337 [Acromyrmex echinatior]|uniref:Uncharacterized protein n=1 Tax=Acromyrmex echinatior TaxID=103372 RepID=F4WR91_ACREC|nr:hypothetical protein G5I_08337 [Acromyrmex echinatior]
MPAAFTYANAHSGISAVAHYALNCVGVTSTSGTSDRQDGPLEMHGKQSGNAQRYAKRRRLRAARTNHSSGYFGSYTSHRQLQTCNFTQRGRQRAILARYAAMQTPKDEQDGAVVSCTRKQCAATPEGEETSSLWRR